MSGLGGGTSIWAMLSFGSYATSILLGIYGRQRSDFSNDFTYNKYHFGVALNILAGTGLYLSAKVPHPYQSAFLFLTAIGLNCVPSYYEGLRDIRNDPSGGDTSLIRRIGFYALIAGYGVLVYKHRKLR
eukprot:403352037